MKNLRFLTAASALAYSAGMLSALACSNSSANDVTGPSAPSVIVGSLHGLRQVLRRLDAARVATRVGAPFRNGSVYGGCIYFRCGWRYCWRWPWRLLENAHIAT